MPMTTVAEIEAHEDELDFARAARRRSCHGIFKRSATQQCSCDRRLPDGRRTPEEVAAFFAQSMVRAHYAQLPERAWLSGDDMTGGGETYRRARTYDELETPAQRRSLRVPIRYLNGVQRAHFRRECHGLWRYNSGGAYTVGSWCWCDRHACDPTLAHKSETGAADANGFGVADV